MGIKISRLLPEELIIDCGLRSTAKGLADAVCNPTVDRLIHPQRSKKEERKSSDSPKLNRQVKSGPMLCEREIEHPRVSPCGHMNVK